MIRQANRIAYKEYVDELSGPVTNTASPTPNPPIKGHKATAASKGLDTSQLMLIHFMVSILTHLLFR